MSPGPLLATVACAALASGCLSAQLMCPGPGCDGGLQDAGANDAGVDAGAIDAGRHAVTSGPRAMDAGPSAAGKPCPPGTLDCLDGTTLLDCGTVNPADGGVASPTPGRWFAVPCQGPAGCSASGTTVSCDFAMRPSQACPSRFEGQGDCSLDGTHVLECRGGAVLKTYDCARGCKVQNGLVICMP